MALFLPVSTLLGGALFTTKPSWLAGYSAPLDVVVPAAGATCKVFARDADQSTATPIPVYPNEDGSGSPLSQPLVADRDGHFAGFVQQPLALDIALAGAGLTARTVKIGLALDAVYDPAGAAAAAQAAAIAAAEAVDIAIAQKGAANGVGTLDSTGRQPIAEVPLLVATGTPPSPDWTLKAWTLASAFRLLSATRDTNEAITTASVVWPDGATGTFTTDTASTSFPGTIDAYHVTYVYGSGPTTKTITQAAVTRDSSGAVTAQPALTVV